MWIDLAAHGDFYNIQEVLLKYRLSATQISQNTNLSQIEEKMNGVTDFKEIDELSKQRDDLQKQIDEKNERYLYLLELQEQIDNQ